MNENQAKNDDLLDATDCLEAIGVFRGWKNFLFIVTILCLLLLQILFWVVDLGLVEIGNQTAAPGQTILPPAADKDARPGDAVETVKVKFVDDVNKIQEAAEKVAADPNVKVEPEPKKKNLLPVIKFGHLAGLMRFLNFVLIIAATLYCLTMLFSLKVSLLGRLGGINHISRAFFLSLAFVVLLLPWQKLFGPVVKGAIYTPGELISWLNWHKCSAGGVLATALHYLRFTGYWLVVLLLAVFAQARSSRWAKATLRRLEII